MKTLEGGFCFVLKFLIRYQPFWFLIPFRRFTHCQPNISLRSFLGSSNSFFSKCVKVHCEDGLVDRWDGIDENSKYQIYVNSIPSVEPRNSYEHSFSRSMYNWSHVCNRVELKTAANLNHPIEFCCWTRPSAVTSTDQEQWQKEPSSSSHLPPPQAYSKSFPLIQCLFLPKAELNTNDSLLCHLVEFWVKLDYWCWRISRSCNKGNCVENLLQVLNFRPLINSMSKAKNRFNEWCLPGAFGMYSCYFGYSSQSLNERSSSVLNGTVYHWNFPRGSSDWFTARISKCIS